MTTEDASNKKYGFYRGKVLKHLENGFCKIWIPGVYPEEYMNSPEKLPPAEQAAPLLFGYQTDAQGVGNGAFSYPDLNAIVWCFFQNGDQNLPVYFASTLGGSGPLNNFNSQTGFTSDEVKAATNTVNVSEAENSLAEVQAQIAEKTAGASRGQMQADSELQALYAKETELQTKVQEEQGKAATENYPNQQYFRYYKAGISIHKDKDIIVIQTDNFTKRQKNAVNSAQSAVENAENDYHEMESKMEELQSKAGTKDFDQQAVAELDSKMKAQQDAIAAKSAELDTAKDELKKLVTQGQIRIDKDGNIEIYAYETLRLKAENTALELEAPKIKLNSTGNIELKAAGEITSQSIGQTYLKSYKKVELDGLWGWPVIAW